MKIKWNVAAISCIMASLLILNGCNAEKKQEYFNASVLETSDGGSLAKDLYAARNPFIGDASADGKLFGLLADQFRVTEKRTTELLTSERPYVFILHFTSAPDEKKMTKISAVLLALIENCDEVRWDYPEGGDTILKQVNIAQAEELLHVSDLKELGTSEENVVKLLRQIEGMDGF